MAPLFRGRGAMVKNYTKYLKSIFGRLEIRSIG